MTLNRRAFLIGSAAFGVAAAWPAPALPTVPAGRPLFTGPFPRTFVFRQCEVLAQMRTYAEWAPEFVPFGGMMGKALPEERTDTVTSRNLRYFNRFKREHPDIVLLLHYNGRARLPLYRTSSWFAGDWLHLAGSTVATPVGATDTTLQVDDASRFSAPTDPFGNVGTDLVLTARTAAGLPDWTKAEQLIVTAVDTIQDTLTVQRGCYGSESLSLPAGAYVAAHATRGPWSAQDGRLWAYNFAVNAPRGPDGLSAAERICAEMALDFAAGGQLFRFDGIELDIFDFPLPSATRSDVDGDGDGVADGCFAAGVDTYLSGQAEFLARLRTAVGNRRIIATDGGTRQRPDARLTNGIEEEGFAQQRAASTPLTLWSTYIGALEQWQVMGRSPAFNYPVIKTGTGIGDPPDFPGVRVSIAAALMAGTQLSFWDEPEGTSLNGLRTPPDSGVFVNRFSVWDELKGGTLNEPAWLGQPVGAATWTALQAPDLLDGAGVRVTAAWQAGLTVSGATVTRVPGPALRLQPTGSDAMTLSFDLTGFPGGDLVLSAEVEADPTPGLPAGVPRLLGVTLIRGATRGSSNHYVTRSLRPIRAYGRQLGAGDVRVQFTFPPGAYARLRAVRLFAAPDTGYRVFDNGAVFVNPALGTGTFDLTGLGSFVRLTATAGQDSEVNDGSALGAAVTIPPCDALVVRRAAP